MLQKILFFIKRRPVLAYFALTIAISWGGVLLLIGGIGGIPANAEQIERLLPFVVLALAIGPSAAGLLLTGLLDGRVGLREFLARLLKWRVGLRWYVVAILTTPILATITLFLLWLTSPVFLPGIAVADDRALLVLSALMAGGVAGLFEEPGWTGFAIPSLRRRYGVLNTGLITGSLWGVWHLIVAFWGSGTPSGEFSWLIFLPQFFFYAAVLPAYRVLMVWVYEHTKSLLVAILMHACLTGGVLFIFMPLAISEIPLLTWYIALAAALWIAVGVIFAINGKTSERKGESRYVPNNL